MYFKSNRWFVSMVSTLTLGFLMLTNIQILCALMLFLKIFFSPHFIHTKCGKSFCIIHLIFTSFSSNKNENLRLVGKLPTMIQWRFIREEKTNGCVLDIKVQCLCYCFEIVWRKQCLFWPQITKNTHSHTHTNIIIIIIIENVDLLFNATHSFFEFFFFLKH